MAPMLAWLGVIVFGAIAFVLFWVVVFKFPRTCFSIFLLVAFGKFSEPILLWLGFTAPVKENYVAVLFACGMIIMGVSGIFLDIPSFKKKEKEDGKKSS